MGVETVEAVSVMCDARGGRTDGVRARGLGAVREAMVVRDCRLHLFRK